jgi:hypothetical protein
MRNRSSRQVFLGTGPHRQHAFANIAVAKEHIVTNFLKLYFDNEYYMTNNTDVEAALHNGYFSNAYEHFIEYGQYENRSPDATFNANKYLLKNPDIFSAILEGKIGSAWEHFVKYGVYEGRNPGNLPYQLDENFYFKKNPDVKAAVEAGHLGSGLEHFLLYGISEGRDPGHLFEGIFNNSTYLEANPDVKAAVEAGYFDSGLEHYLLYGMSEGRDPVHLLKDIFNNSVYLEANPDVKAAVEAGYLGSGFEHFLLYGISEGRDPGHMFEGIFNNSTYLETNLDVKAAVETGYFSSGFEHYLAYGRAEGRAAFNTTGKQIDSDQPGEALPSVSVTGPAQGVTEGSNATFTLTRTGNTDAALEVSYSLASTAAAGSDFTAPPSWVVFAAGETTVTVTVQTADDATDEADETIVLTVAQRPTYTITEAVATATIFDNDGPPAEEPMLPTLSVTDMTMNEDDGNMVFAVSLSAPATEDVIFQYATANGTAVDGEDYAASGGEGRISTGETEVQIVITVFNDQDFEADETIFLNITGVSTDNATIVKAQGVGTLINDDNELPTGTAGILLFEPGSTEVAEGGEADTIGVVLTRKPTADVIIEVGADPGITLSQQTITFTPQNWNVVQNVTVTADDDTDYEGTHSAGVYFSPAVSTDPLYNGMYTDYDPLVSIIDNDEPTNTAPSAIDVTTDTYDTALSVDVEGFGYDNEDASNVAYEIVSQPAEGTVTFLPDGKTFHFEGHAELLDTLNRGEIMPVTFQYQVSDGELISAPAEITINVHGTNPGDETIQAFTRTTPSQKDFFPLDGGDGNDTVVFNSVTLTSGSGLEISLGKTIKWTEYDGKPLVNIENITIKNTDGNTARTMTVGGDGLANVITIENTNHKLFVNGGGGNDTINFKGTGNGLTSIIDGGAGDDTVNAGSAVVTNVADGNDTVNVFNGSNVTVQNFSAGDRLNFAAGIQASNVSAAVVGSNTVFTVNQDGVTSTVTVAGATGLQAGTDWTAEDGEIPSPSQLDLNWLV